MKKCKNCGSRFEPRFSTLEKYCWDPECKTIEAFEKLDKFKKQERSEWAQRRKKMDIEVNPVKYKKMLQDEINKLARMIDNRFKLHCIDCGKPFGNQQDGGHFKSVGSNPSLRFNLHNIHSQRSECNQNGIGGGRERQYYQGLVNRYSEEYANYVDIELQKKFKYVGLKNHEIPEKLKIVRGLIRDFDTYIFENPQQARDMLNKIIGIYS
jgi:hypothetical protein